MDERCVVLGDNLSEDVVGTGTHHDVVALVDGRQLVGHDANVAVDTDADEGLSGEPELQRIGHGDDLHDAEVSQSLDPPPHRSLRDANGIGDLAVGPTPVALEGLDDATVGVVNEGRALRAPLT